MPALVRADRVHVPAGGWRGRDVLDPAGRRLGTSKRGVLYDGDGQVIARLAGVGGGRSRWGVEDGNGFPVGMLLSASRTDRNGRMKPVRNRLPFTWTGWIHDYESASEIAYITRGQVIRYPEEVLAAELLIGDARWWGTTSMWADWTLRYRSCDDDKLRLMCLAWFQLAWTMQRTSDTSD